MLEIVLELARHGLVRVDHADADHGQSCETADHLPPGQSSTVAIAPASPLFPDDSPLPRGASRPRRRARGRSRPCRAPTPLREPFHIVALVLAVKTARASTRARTRRTRARARRGTAPPTPRRRSGGALLPDPPAPRRCTHDDADREDGHDHYETPFRGEPEPRQPFDRPPPAQPAPLEDEHAARLRPWAAPTRRAPQEPHRDEMRWRTGFEPATTGTTTRGSTN